MFKTKALVVLGGMTAIFTWGCGSHPVAPAATPSPSGVEAKATSGASVSSVSKRGPLPPTTTSAKDLSESTVASMVATTHEAFAGVCQGANAADPTSLALYEKACKTNDGEGCVKVGAMYMCGTGVEKNDGVAMSMFEKSCELGDAQGCQAYAGAYIEGVLVPRDMDKAMNTFATQCERGSAQACATLGGIYGMNADERDVPRALAALERACDEVPDACANMAVLENKEIGSHPRNPARTFALAKKACEAQSLFGCTVLGMAYAEGVGVQQNQTTALKLFTLACEAGHAQGCLNLGKCHYSGIGTQRDPSKAAVALRKACDGGNGQACRLLADLSLAHNAAPPNDVNPVMF